MIKKYKTSAYNTKSLDSIVKVGRNFQITIPHSIRKYIDISEGDYVKTCFVKGQIVLKPVDVIAREAATKAKNIDEDKMWNEHVLREFLDGYDEADSVYDNL